MSEKTKPRKAESSEKKPLKPGTRDDRASRNGDRTEKSYYYDDACGYEVYRPDAEEDEQEEEEKEVE